MIGEQILNYRIQAKIGEGGMGSVYLAIHNQLNRKAAIKALHPTLVNNIQIRERFKNEAATMAHLRHPNIVNLYDYLETPNGLFLIMEFVEGDPLDSFIKETTGPMPEARAVRIFSKILDGFDYAHQQGVVHRDIKPSNLIITPGDDVKILDFGIAKLLDGSVKSLTKTGSRMGTVLYMSPEQVKGQEVDQRSDIYALGVTLFQMLTGKAPYDENNATEYEVYSQIVNNPLPRAKSIYPTVSDRLQGIIDKATAKNPAQRFQNCQEFKDALLRGGLAQTLPGQNQQANLSNKQHTPPSKKSKRRLYSLSILLILLLLTAFSLIVVFNPFHIKAFENLPLLSFIKKAAPADQVTVQDKITAFFQAEESHNFSSISPFYHDMIENYYGANQVTRGMSLKAAYEAYWNKFAEEERHEIDWNTLEYTQDENGNHIVICPMKYYFKKGDTWKNYLTKYEIRFNTDWKIYYIKRS
ncbi:MAG: serine/threonine-protein kinase [Microscillaceae bacterium]|nr:serine/threonine-protein kinase [Microscillaceae bacterium]